MLQDIFWAIQIKFYTALFTQELMVYSLISLSTWNAVTMWSDFVGVYGIVTDRIKLYFILFTPCGGCVAEGNKHSGCLKGNFIYVLIILWDSLYSFGWIEISYVYQVGLKLLLLIPDAGIRGVCYHIWA